MNYQQADCIQVKPGTVCPDAPNLDISGWQGRVVDLQWVEAEEPVIGLAWDSISLQALPDWYIKESEREGFDWARMYLSLDEIEPAEPRDTERDVKRAKSHIERRFGWFSIGPEGERIQAVVNSAKGRGEWPVMKAWTKHLRRQLQFPFAARVDEYQEHGSLQAGDRLTVTGIVDVDDLYGVIVSCRQKREHFSFPLADLAAWDKNSPNAQLVDDYRVWFANR